MKRSHFMLSLTMLFLFAANGNNVVTAKRRTTSKGGLLTAIEKGIQPREMS